MSATIQEPTVYTFCEEDGECMHTVRGQIEGDTAWVSYVFDEPEDTHREVKVFMPTTLFLKLAPKMLADAGGV